MTMRIKFEIPKDALVFETNIQVRIDDINYGQHLSNDRLLVYAHEARMRYFKSLGFKDEKSIAGKSIIMSDSAIMYRHESVWGDELKVSLSVPAPHLYGFDIYYCLTNLDGHEVARVKTGLVFYDYAQKKLLKAPMSLKDLIAPKLTTI